KRHALYCGFGEARGEVIVTVDSDSEVLTDTLKNLVAPLVYDANVGAVAGVVRVLNRKGPIPAMLDVSFTYAFDFIRASESVLGAVVCCPGALSAYRRSLIDEVKDEWMEQTVFGRPANIGEDRALTNQVLRRGLRVELQSTALVFTKVPTRFRGLWKMLLRWARSNARETFMLGRFVFRRFRRDHLTAIRLLFTHHALTMLVAGILFPCTLVAVALQPSILLWIALTSLLVATVPAAVYATRRQPQNCLWGFAYGLLSAFATSWITPWALITPHRTGWLTRGPGRPLKQPRGLTAA
ncbi:MAG: glycosyltransferase family 2 protein, partial [Myxococcota bacterium]